MSINVYNLEQAILDKMNSSSSELELLEYSKMLTELKTGIVQVVDTFASLPTASESVGHLYYVQDEKTVYWAIASVGWVTLETQQAGILYVWGVSGSMPFPASGNISSPVREVSSSVNWSVVCSSDNAYGAGLKSNGSLWTWGSTGYGARWTNNTTSYSSPVREVSSSVWSTFSTGDTAMFAIKTDGTLWVAGNNFKGTLGLNNVTCYSSPVQEITSSTNWSNVSVGQFYLPHTISRKTDNTIWVWGSNYNGILGTNNTTAYSSPVQEISSSTNWNLISAAGEHSMATKTDGSLWLWGRGLLGRIGNNSTVNRSSPVQEITSSTNWCFINSGYRHSMGIKNDGTLWLWGANDPIGATGLLGDGTGVDRSSPVQEITSSTNWCHASGSRCSTGGVKTDGSLWVWGKNDQGHLGTNNTTSYSSPVREVTSSNIWDTVLMGCATLALSLTTL